MVHPPQTQNFRRSLKSCATQRFHVGRHYLSVVTVGDVTIARDLSLNPDRYRSFDPYQRPSRGQYKLDPCQYRIQDQNNAPEGDRLALRCAEYDTGRPQPLNGSRSQSKVKV